MLHVVVVLVEHLLRLCQESLSLLLINHLLLSRRHLSGSLLVQVKHFLFSCLGSSHSGVFLFLEEASLLDLLLLGLNLGGTLHAFKLVMLNHDGLRLLALLSLFTDVSQLLLSEGGGTGLSLLFTIAYNF